MLKRDLEPVLHQAARSFKAVTIIGPRQAGKTTLVRMAFSDRPYLSLEDADVRRLAVADPRALLNRYGDGCILDEVQRAPDLLSHLQLVLDESRQPGRFILTGSQQLGVMERVSQSLAGRTAILTLLPFSAGELSRNGMLPVSMEEALFRGGYPPIFDQGAAPEMWLNSYQDTYVERDVRQLLNVRDLALFSRFLALCAGSVGQLFNASRLGADCGINHGTVQQWMSVLEASFIVFRLPVHSRNFRKRLVKSPKMYFYDTGLATRLLGIESPQQLHTHPLRGALFENWVVAELLKGRHNKGKKPNLHFWRDSLGLEVDVIVESGQHLQPIEVKSGTTIADDWFNGLARWSDLAGTAVKRQYLVYGGEKSWERKGVSIVPWHEITRLAEVI